MFFVLLLMFAQADVDELISIMEVYMRRQKIMVGRNYSALRDVF